MKFIPHVIDGHEAESASGARFASVDPWRREPYAEVALGVPRRCWLTRRPRRPGRSAGLPRGVVLPTVVENAPPDARVCREEVFGPVVTITPFDTDAEAIRLANDTPYGLNAMVFTRDLSRAHRASAALKADVPEAGTLVAEGISAPDGPAAELPGPVSLAEARAAGARSRLRIHPDEHPFPGCFVCGPARARGDGLRIMVGPVAGRDLCADVWYPDEPLAGADGDVRPEFVWAAVDCAGGVALADAAPAGPPHILGRLSVRLLAAVRTGQPHIVAGWRVAEEGRKLTAGSAPFTAVGQAAGIARATWIRPRAAGVG